ncbi:hypothetical protein L1049_007940 [Liquidambar formosana]|uniref:AB hydrolase-1 domain-containing protein n=1 Tax=Liquidambar formosana TaxID=63359 RepID=A0AAP0X486_LIQFO
MAGGVNRKVSAASARAHTRRAKQNSSFQLPSGMFKKILVVLFMGVLAWAYQAIQPPSPKICGSPDGPPVTAPRIKLSDGRHLAYKEHGVPKDIAKYKIVFVHAFDACRHDAVVATTISPEMVESFGIYIVSFDRPGYGESDPNPKQTRMLFGLMAPPLKGNLQLSGQQQPEALIRQQGEYESLHRDMLIAFGTWEFDPMDLKNPFPNNEGSVHLWQGDEDRLLPVTLQRYIAQRLPWIKYHELPGAGHLFPYADGMSDAIIKALLIGEK